MTTPSDPVHVVTDEVSRPIRIVTHGIADPVRIMADGSGDLVRIVTKGISDPVRIVQGVWPPIPPGPLYEIPSYANVGGTGDRHLLIIATSGINPIFSIGIAEDLVSNIIGTVYWSNHVNSPGYVRFQFNGPKIINEAKWYQDVAAAQGVWNWQGSNNGFVWVNIGNNFTLNGLVTGVILTELSSNVTPYIYYQLLAISGGTTNAPYLNGIDFKIGNQI